jgi:hypothetical protein
MIFRSKSSVLSGAWLEGAIAGPAGNNPTARKLQRTGCADPFRELSGRARGSSGIEPEVRHLSFKPSVQLVISPGLKRSGVTQQQTATGTAVRAEPGDCGGLIGQWGE